MANNDQSTVLTFEWEPFEVDFDKEVKWFLESSPYGSSKEDAIQYTNILAAAKPSAKPYVPAVIQSTDVGRIL